MIALKLLVVYWLIGAAWQVGFHLASRRRLGNAAADAGIRILLGRRWPLKIFTSCFFWPITAYGWFFARQQLVAGMRGRAGRKYEAVVEHLQTHCPDCGEPLDEHDMGPPQ